MITYAFAGQGSQHPGMGAALFSRHPKMMRIAHEVLGYSIEDLCLSGGRKLNQTEYTQPAVFVVNALTYIDTLNRSGQVPSFLLGHSLGELNALHVAGVFDFETGLCIVKKRGELMSRCGADGTMAALLGEREQLLAFLEQGGSDVYLAIDNSPRQIVVAGKRQAIARLEASVRQRGLGIVVPLVVSGAFHSPLMGDARDEFADFLTTQPIRAPNLPVVANVSASPYQPNELCIHLADLLVRPVRWVDSIRYLLERGPMLFQEIGPGHIVSSLIRQIILCPHTSP